jgi:quinoprotein glucose dehydrogenase
LNHTHAVQRRRSFRQGSGRAAFITALCLLAAAPLAAAPDDDWANYGHDAGGARHSPLTQITTANVGKLKKLWTYHMRPAGTKAETFPGANPELMRRFSTGFAASEATPLVIKGVMYLSTPYRRVVALDASTGQEKWFYELPNRDQASTRGVAYWPGDRTTPPRIVFGTRSGMLIALDAATGKPAQGFGTDGTITLKTPEVMNGTKSPLGMSSPPAIYKNLIITGTRVQEMPVKGAAGDVRAWDAKTGALVWTFHTVPRPGDVGYDTWEKGSTEGRSGTNVWTMPEVDTARGIVYLPIGAPTLDRWGGDRKGMNLFANSVVAVDAKTGKYLWHFQTVHHDIWDLDLPVLNLIDLRKDGKVIPALVAMNKTAIMFVLNRVTGKPIIDVKEVPVPTASDVESEQPWPTQPMPVSPAPLGRTSFSMDEILDATPELSAACHKAAVDMDVVPSKLFQPLSKNHSVNTYPSSLGGVDWGGGAFDPATGYYVITVNALGAPSKLVQSEDGSWNTGYTYFVDTKTGIPCQKPPFGELVAVDVAKGKVAWRHPIGDYGNPALKDAGTFTAGGPITTAGGITFVGATRDKHIRAFDTRTGKLLWEDVMADSNYGVPMTYRTPGGKQVMAVVGTGGFGFAPANSDELVAYALP